MPLVNIQGGFILTIAQKKFKQKVKLSFLLLLMILTIIGLLSISNVMAEPNEHSTTEIK